MWSIKGERPSCLEFDNLSRNYPKYFAWIHVEIDANPEIERGVTEREST